ncbi:MAG: ribosome maturation factor RimM [Sphingomicrobium sp.]|nr:ribosome maturation factor RimM [Sphingomonadales bacterium]
MTSSAPAGERRIALAAVAGAHGIAGEVRLKLFANNLDNFRSGQSLFVGDRAMRLTSIKSAGKTPIARFAGIADRFAAEALRGALIEIDRVALPTLAEDQYYHADLIGLPCIDADGIPYGAVVAVENYGAGDLLEIEDSAGRRLLIPFQEQIAARQGDHIVIDPAFLA